MTPRFVASVFVLCVLSLAAAFALAQDVWVVSTKFRDNRDPDRAMTFHDVKGQLVRSQQSVPFGMLCRCDVFETQAMGERICAVEVSKVLLAACQLK